MILQLVRRDPAWKAIPYALVAALVRGIVFGRNTTEFVVAFSSPLIVMAVLLLVVNQLSSAGFLSHLPISVSDIYSARVLSLTLLLVATLATEAPWLHGIGPEEFMAAVWLLALIAQSVMVTRQSGFRPWMFGLSFVAGSFLPMIRLWAPQWITGGRAAGVTLACLLAGVCIFLWRWSTLPPSLQMAPLGVRANARPSSRGTWRWPLMVYHWRFWLICGVVLMQTANLGFSAVGFGAFGVLGLIQTQHWIFRLPISRRLLLTLWVTPVLLVAMAGCAARLFSPWWWPPSEITVTGHPGNFRAPLEIWQFAGSGSVPMVQAPWGERISPAFIGKAGRTAYNPYTVGAQSSERFVDWQLGRARNAFRAPEVRWRILASETILLLSFAFLGTAAVLSDSWERMRWRAVWLRWTPFGVYFLIWMFALLPPLASRWNVRDLLVRLSWILPHSWAAVALIPAVVFLFAADKLFRGGEFIEKARPAKLN